MKSFQEFCSKLATAEKITSTCDKYDMEKLTSEYRILAGTIEVMKTKIGRADKIMTPVFISYTFDTIIESETDKQISLMDLDVSDELLSCLSHELLNKSIDVCNNDELSIIKVLTAYIILQN